MNKAVGIGMDESIDINDINDIIDRNVRNMNKDDIIPETPENNIDATDSINVPRPSVEQLEDEINRLETGKEIKNSIFGTIKSLIVIAAAAVLVANLLIAVLQVNKTSMNPTLREGEVVIAVRWLGVNQGDIIAFHYNNKILLKRVIAKESDVVNIDDYGNVYVNGEFLDEPYLTERSLGECDIDFPYQVPAGTVFVMGDHRSTSADSRLKEIGPVSTDLIVGKVLLRIWPLANIGVP